MKMSFTVDNKKCEKGGGGRFHNKLRPGKERTAIVNKSLYDPYTICCVSPPKPIVLWDDSSHIVSIGIHSSDEKGNLLFAELARLEGVDQMIHEPVEVLSFNPAAEMGLVNGESGVVCRTAESSCKELVLHRIKSLEVRILEERREFRILEHPIIERVHEVLHPLLPANTCEQV
jgi:hypothetical protein